MNRLLKMILFGVAFGIVLLAIKIFFDIPEQTFWKLYLVVGATVIFGACLINIAYYAISMNKMLRLAPILEIEQNPKKYIAENIKLQRNTKNRYIRALINLNLVAAYCDLGEFDTAWKIMESCNIGEIKGPNIVVYHINQIYLLFRLGEKDRAIQLMEQHKKILQNFRNHKTLGANIAILNIYRNLSQGEKEKAQASLIVVKDRWHSNRMEQEYQHLEHLLADG